MSIDVFNDRTSAQGMAVYPANDFRVSNGANLGDPIGDASEIILDDIYRLTLGAKSWRLALSTSDGLDRLSIAKGSELGRVGAQVHLDSCVTVMAPDGTTVDALILVELEPGASMISEVYLMPFAAIAPRTDYSLVDVDAGAALARFAELACVSFTRGTRITVATGEQRPIESLRVGDKVLTRDNGVQKIRWIGQQTARATGAFAPIVIAKGTLNNENELVLSPNQRIFIYQRQDRVNAGRREVMVKAELLVNNTTVVRSAGGFVEYYQLLFDNHEIVYAEGIATESMPMDTRTKPTVPKEVRERMQTTRGTGRRAPQAIDLAEGMIDSALAADILRRASTH